VGYPTCGGDPLGPIIGAGSYDLALPAYQAHNGARVRDDAAAGGGTDEEERMQHPTKTRALRCPCGSRMLAGDEEALQLMFREHLEREHPP
jgi:hypothetical protein